MAQYARGLSGDDEGVFAAAEVQSAHEWLEKAKPLVLLRPAAKLCIEKALKFLPKLKRAIGKGDDGDDGDDALDGILG